MNNKIWLAIFLVAALVVVGWVFNNDRVEETVDDNAEIEVVEETDDESTDVDDKSDLIKVTNIVSGQAIASPLTITGEARGTWYFEASFPIQLLNADGEVLATAIAQAQGDWMTEKFVPFTATLNFNPVRGDANGSLVLQKDNPSGLPENDDQLIIPVKLPSMSDVVWEFPGTLPAQQIENKQVRISTAKGDIVFKLYPDTAPLAVSNLVYLATGGYYDGVIFHRREEGFVIQGGDPTGTGRGGPGYSFPDELKDNRTYTRGTVAMANAGPNTNGSQIFIMLDDVPLPHLYTIFGEVTEGMEVVDQIKVGDVMTKVTVEEIE